MSKVGRNDPCPCGSGKKYKKCCGQKSPIQRRSFANLTPESVKSSMGKISGMVSQNLGTDVASKVEHQAGQLADRLSSGAPEKTNKKEASKKTEEENPPESLSSL